MKKLCLGAMLFISSFISISWIYSSFIFESSMFGGTQNFTPFLVINHQTGLFIFSLILAIYGLIICIEGAFSQQYLKKK